MESPVKNKKIMREATGGKVTKSAMEKLDKSGIKSEDDSKDL